MSERIQHARDTFGPQLFKTFEGALGSFLETECPQLGGLRTRQTLVGAIAELVHAHFPSTSHLGQGQIRWTAVHKDEKSSYGKTISQSQLTPVVLDLLPPGEIAARAQGAKLREVKIEAVARLFTQAYEQCGVLTNAEVALLLKLSPGTVGTYRRGWEKEHDKLLPTRGSIHDMGPTLTHKKIILQKLIFEGKTVEVVCRETDHSPEAVLMSPAETSIPNCSKVSITMSCSARNSSGSAASRSERSTGSSKSNDGNWYPGHSTEDSTECSFSLMGSRGLGLTGAVLSII